MSGRCVGSLYHDTVSNLLVNILYLVIGNVHNHFTCTLSSHNHELSQCADKPRQVFYWGLLIMITCIINYYHVVCTCFLHNDVIIVLNLINFVDDCV